MENPKSQAVVIASEKPQNYLWRVVESPASSPATSQDEALKLALVNAQYQMTLEKAMAQPDQISALKRKDPQTLEMLILLILDNLAESLNVKSSFTPAQMVDCTQMIIKYYWFLKPEEILYALERARLGRYDPSYNKLDTEVVLNWLHLYNINDRQDYIDRRGQIEAQEEEARQQDLQQELQKRQLYPKPGEKPFVVRLSEEKRQKALDQHKKEIDFQRFMIERHAKKTNRQSPF